MNLFMRLLAMYGPLLFLATLAATSFLLAPTTSTTPAPLYSASLQDINYARLQPNGTLQLGAQQLKQIDEERAELTHPHLRQDFKNGMIELQGKNGEALSQNDNSILRINHVFGTISNNDILLTLRADAILYDVAAKTLSGDNSRFFSASGELRGERFLWNPKNGLKIEGNVQTSYY
ncbi:MAG: hypothetical protein ACNYPH_00220 [Gammaproteobacteria bacterium WSBS_2016_MAG_OTU1]